MSYRETELLRVLIANERKDRLALVALTVATPGPNTSRRSSVTRAIALPQGVRQSRPTEADTG
jgi:hypothetical protein